MSEAMDAEFGTVAEWTAEVARDLGPSFHIPAGCRGSGSPAALDWLTEHLDLDDGQTFLDSGAGVGGPAAYLQQQVSVRPVLAEPEAGACRAARTLFGYPTVQASATELPFADRSCDAGWSLGVMCTIDNHLQFLTELNRVIRGRIGVLVFVAAEPEPAGQPEGNHFPTRESLIQHIDRSGLRIVHRRGTAEMPAIPEQWEQQMDTVADELARRHRQERPWQLAEHQSGLMGALLDDGAVTGELLVLQRR